ncbi:sodium:proton antiporter [Halalkalicoccus salilacus]|uniref:sodium:proton antiporter n=1 Tax=Halalkalicoccus salilacus TaxID=3117459 RepID=UPI00300EEB69
MSLAISLAVGTLFAVGTFLLFRRDPVIVIWGTVVISQATLVYLISMGGLRAGTYDLVPVLAGYETPKTADPVVQALVLTAIVISFGTTALALVLSYRAYTENGTMDISEWS